jgi:hypothetical protein
MRTPVSDFAVGGLIHKLATTVSTARVRTTRMRPTGIVRLAA